MASIYLQIYAKCDEPICVCDEVVVTLDDSWATKVLTGLPIVYGKVYAIYPYAVPTLPYTNQTLCCTNVPAPTQSTGCLPVTETSPTVPNDCCGGCVTSNPNTVQCDMCVYQVEIDTSQFEDDPETGAPYEPACSDVVEITPYKATIKILVDAISGLLP